MRTVHLFIVCLSLWVLGLTGTVAAESLAAQKISFQIDAPSMAQALLQFTEQSQLQLAFTREQTTQLSAPRVVGEYTPREALDRLLARTGLRYEFVNERTVKISSADASAVAAMRMVQNDRADSNLSSSEGQNTQDTENKTEDSSSKESDNTVQEIVVTAQKRVERLQDVPVPVTLVNVNSLLNNNQVRLQDYFTRVPGLNFQAGTRAEPLISIRGLNSTQNPTVGVVVDDLPYGSSIFRGAGNFSPDLDPSDLSHIEVLRGPQGTLYGVSTLGGLIKYVTVPPSTERMSGNIRTGVSSVQSGHELGFDLSAGINVPLSDVLAVRASAFTRTTPGYIDNISVSSGNAEDVNSSTVSGARVAALYQPSDAFSIKLAAQLQEKDLDAMNLANPALGDLKQNYLKGLGEFKPRGQDYSATILGKVGTVELTSLSGYNISRNFSSLDFTTIYGGNANTNFGVTGAGYIENWEAKKFTQELRLQTNLGRNLELLLGGFFTNEKFNSSLDVMAVNASTGAIAGRLSRSDANGKYQEYAGFADLTVHMGERFDVQVGARRSHNSQTFSSFDTGPIVTGGSSAIPRIKISDTPMTYLLTPRLRLSQDLMLYARFASGYRAGGVNTNVTRAPVPPGYGADKSYSYEAGAKGSWFGGALSFDASVFYVDWKDLQLSFSYAAGINYQDNAGRAKSQGAELSIEARPLRGMTIVTSMSYDDAVLIEDFPGANGRPPVSFGLKGDRLPFSSRLAGALSLDQQFPISGDWAGTVGASFTYVGDRLGLFRPTAVRQIYPSYTQLDLRTGVDFNTWNVNAYVTNVSDRRGLIGGGIGQSVPALFSYIQPRTVGLSIAKTF